MKTGLVLLLGTIIGAGLAWIETQAVRETCFEARYADAVIYAGATDFVFQLASGEQFNVRSSHEDRPVAGSTPLLGTARDAPAEAAADRLGRIHVLCIAHDGITIRFEGD